MPKDLPPGYRGVLEIQGTFKGGYRGSIGDLWQFPKMREPQYRPQNTMILIMRTPKRVAALIGETPI